MTNKFTSIDARVNTGESVAADPSESRVPVVRHPITRNQNRMNLFLSLQIVQASGAGKSEQIHSQDRPSLGTLGHRGCSAIRWRNLAPLHHLQLKLRPPCLEWQFLKTALARLHEKKNEHAIILVNHCMGSMCLHLSMPCNGNYMAGYRITMLM